MERIKQLAITFDSRGRCSKSASSLQDDGRHSNDVDADINRVGVVGAVESELFFQVERVGGCRHVARVTLQGAQTVRVGWERKMDGLGRRVALLDSRESGGQRAAARMSLVGGVPQRREKWRKASA